MIKYLLLTLALMALNPEAQATLKFDYQSTSPLGATKAAYATAWATVLTQVNTSSLTLTSGPTGTFGGFYLDSSASSHVMATGLDNLPATGSAITILMRVIPLNSTITANTGLFSMDNSRVAGIGASLGLAMHVNTSNEIVVTGGTQANAAAWFNDTACGTALTFTQNVPSDIWITWDGSTTTNAFKIYQAQNGQTASLICSMTSGGVNAGWNKYVTQEMDFYDAADGFNNSQIAYNEVAVWDDVETPSSYGARTGFVTSTVYEGYNFSSLSAASVATGTAFGPGPGSLTGTLSLPSVNDVRNGVTVGASTGNLVVPTTGQVEHGVTFGTSSGLTGTYIGADLYSDPLVANVRTGTTYQFNSATSNRTGTLNLPNASVVKLSQSYDGGNEVGTLTCTDPGIANVAAGVDYEIYSVALVGTVAGGCVDPSVGNVLGGVNYMINGANKTGTYVSPAEDDVVSGTDYGVGLVGTYTDLVCTDPGQTNVVASTAYTIAGVAKLGSLQNVTNVLQKATLLALTPALNATAQLSITQGDVVTLNLQAVVGPTLVPAVLSGATYQSWVLGPKGPVLIPNSAHTTNSDQVTYPGYFTITLTAAQTASFAVGTYHDVVTQITQGGSVLYYHGQALLNILANTPN